MCVRRSRVELQAIGREPSASQAIRARLVHRPAPELPEESGAAIDLSERNQACGQAGSPPLAAHRIARDRWATLWLRNARARGLDSQSTFGYLSCFPLLLIVAAGSPRPELSAACWHFGAAGRRAGLLNGRAGGNGANIFAIAGFGTALWRIFGS